MRDEQAGLEQLIEAAARGDLERFRDALGPAPNPRALHVAAAHGFIAGAKLLLEAGAVVDARDANQRTPLIEAALGGQRELVELLLEQGADLGASDRGGVTPLLAALGRAQSCRSREPGDYLEAIDLALALLDKGADPSARVRGNTALHLAAKLGEPRLLAALVGKVEVTTRNEDDALPLHLAAASKRPEGLALLLATSLESVNAGDRYGWTPLHYLCDVGGPEPMFTLLLAAGADPQIESSQARGGRLPAGSSPIAIARHWNDADAVAWLGG